MELRAWEQGSELIARACNQDGRFTEAGWEETAEGIATVLRSERFRVALNALVPSGRRPTLAMVVAAVYQYREDEQGYPHPDLREGKPPGWSRLSV